MFVYVLAINLQNLVSFWRLFPEILMHKVQGRHQVRHKLFTGLLLLLLYNNYLEKKNIKTLNMNIEELQCYCDLAFEFLWLISIFFFKWYFFCTGLALLICSFKKNSVCFERIVKMIKIEILIDWTFGNLIE